MAVIAGGNHDDDTAFRAGSFSGSHTLDRLINVLIQRITVVGGDDDVCRNPIGLAQSLQKFGTGKMRLLTVTGESTHYLVLCIDNHIADEGKLGSPGGVDHIPVDGIALQNAGSGMGSDLDKKYDKLLPRYARRYTDNQDKTTQSVDKNIDTSSKLAPTEKEELIRLLAKLDVQQLQRVRNYINMLIDLKQ